MVYLIQMILQPWRLNKSSSTVLRLLLKKALLDLKNSENTIVHITQIDLVHGVGRIS